MKNLKNLFVCLAIITLGSSAFGQAVPIDPGFYYKIQFKTSSNQYLHIAWNGVAMGGDEDKIEDDYARWLFIPTENLNEYWIFNKGAQNGFGQTLTLPQGKNDFGQWDFLDEDRQRFSIQADGEYFKLKLKHNNELVSTRWNSAAFTWGDTPGDDQQKFRLIKAEPISSKDMLPSFLFWNIDNEIIRNYFDDCCNFLPDPKVLKLEKLVFINNSSKKITPAIHHHGCGGIPWRDGLAQCWYEDLEPGEKTTFIVNGYLQNASAIWQVIATTAVVVVSVAATIASAGAAAPAAAAATSSVIGTATSTTAIAAAAGTTVSSTISAAAIASATAEIALFAFDMYEVGTLLSNLSKADGIPVNADLVMNSFGVDEDRATIITKELGQHAFAAKGDRYKDLMEGWYVHECATDLGFNKMFYGGGKAVFVVSDYDVEGTWWGEGQNNFSLITRTNQGIEVKESETPGGPIIRGPFKYNEDPVIPNRFTNSEGNSFNFTSHSDFYFQKKDGSGKNTYQRLYDFEGRWQLVGEQIFLSTTQTNAGLKITKLSTGEAETYKRSYADPNVYENAEGNYTFTRSNDLEYRNKAMTISKYYKRTEDVQNVSFQSSNYSDRYIRSRSGFGWIEPLNPEIGTTSESDFYFLLAPGLADPAGVSIKNSREKSYFRNREFRISLEASDNSQLFKESATFYRKPALDGSNGVSFELKNNPGYYIRHQGFALFVQKNDGSMLFAGDASFKIIDK